jgi:5-methylcytosine-specific restriction protein A
MKDRRWINKYLRPGHQPRTLTGGHWPFDCLRAKRDWKRICCWCGHDLPKGRRSWCSQACVDDYQMKHDWGKIRAAVERRDRGICVMCGIDTEKLKRVLRHARSLERRWPIVEHPAWATVPKIAADACREYVRSMGWIGVAVELGFDANLSYDWWQADHIKPRHDGGGHELTNLRTLCIPCHKEVSRQFAAERAARRRLGGGTLTCPRPSTPTPAPASSPARGEGFRPF